MAKCLCNEEVQSNENIPNQSSNPNANDVFHNSQVKELNEMPKPSYQVPPNVKFDA